MFSFILRSSYGIQHVDQQRNSFEKCEPGISRVGFSLFLFDLSTSAAQKSLYKPVGMLQEIQKTQENHMKNNMNTV